MTGGSYFDGIRNNAQLVEWSGSNLAVDRLTGWYWTGNTVLIRLHLVMWIMMDKLKSLLVDSTLMVFATLLSY